MENATTGVTNGSVIVFHESRQDTKDQLEVIVGKLRRINYFFSTFSELDRKKQLRREG